MTPDEGLRVSPEGRDPEVIENERELPTVVDDIEKNEFIVIE